MSLDIERTAENKIRTLSLDTDQTLIVSRNRGVLSRLPASNSRNNVFIQAT